jgi:putative transposase
MESFKSKHRDECINEHVFSSLAEARRIIEIWHIDYNTMRPHSRLDYLTRKNSLQAGMPRIHSTSQMQRLDRQRADVLRFVGPLRPVPLPKRRPKAH